MAERKKQALSPRHAFARRMAQLVRENKLGRATTPKLEELDGRKFYQVPFEGGRINVYGPEFVQVEYKMGDRDEARVFETTNRAERFFRMAVINGNWKEAAKIPTKKPQEEVDKE